jgi:hypothetical protein
MQEEELDQTLETSTDGFIEVLDLTEDGDGVAVPIATAMKPRRR